MLTPRSSMWLWFFCLLGKTCWRWLEMYRLYLSEVCLFLLSLFLCSLFWKDRDLHEVEGNCKNGWTCFLWKLLPLWYHRRICPWREVLQPEMCPASKKQVGAIIKHRNREFGVKAAAWEVVGKNVNGGAKGGVKQPCFGGSLLVPNVVLLFPVWSRLVWCWRQPVLLSVCCVPLSDASGKTVCEVHESVSDTHPVPESLELR